MVVDGRRSTIYYLAKGLTKAQIGVVEGLMPLVGVTAQSAWAVLADVYKARTRVYLVTSVFGTLSLLLLGVPRIVGRDFKRILGVSLLTRLFCSAGILDAYALDVLDAPQLYGRLRLWGSVGWGCGALAMGIINDHFGFGPNFIVFGVANLLRIVLLGSLVPEYDSKSPRFDDLSAVLASSAFLVLMAEVLVFGMAIGVVERLLFVYVVDDLKGSTTLCGLVVFVSSLCNIPIFQNAAWFLRVVGHHRLMLLSQFCYFTRVVGYTLLRPQTAYFILVLETLHGFTFAALWIAAVEQTRRLAPDGWQSTFQSLLQTVYYSLGPGLGALTGGFLWHRYNARFMYRAFAAAVALLFALRSCFLARLHCTTRRKEILRLQSDETLQAPFLDDDDRTLVPTAATTTER